MNIAKKFAGLLIVALLSSTSWGMEESKGREPFLPDECQDNGDLAQSSFPDVLKMAEWSKEEVEGAISDARFAEHEAFLLKNLEKIVMEKMEPLIRDNKDFLAAFLAYYVGINAVMKNARLATRAVTGKAPGEAAMDDAHGAIGDTARNAAWFYAMQAALEVPQKEARDADGRLAKYAVCISLEKLGLEDAADIRNAESRLRTLHVLTHVSQNKYFDDLKTHAFLAAKSQLEEDRFSMPISEILPIIGGSTWDNQALAENPHIMMLGHIFKGFAQRR